MNCAYSVRPAINFVDVFPDNGQQAPASRTPVFPYDYGVVQGTGRFFSELPGFPPLDVIREPMSEAKRRQEAAKHTIPAVAKALDVIRLLATEKREETTTKALAMRLGVPRTTCYRIIRSLIAKDWIQPTADGYHVLSLGLLPLLEPFRRMEHLAELVQPALSTLALRAEMTTKISVRQGDYAVTIARGRSAQQTSVSLPLGGTFHLSYGASGAVLLSQIDAEEVSKILKRAPEECWTYQKPQDVIKRIRDFEANGWCADLGKFNPNINTISIPLKRGRHDIVAALTLIGFPQDFRRARLPSLIKMAQEAARQAEKDLRVLGAAEPVQAPVVIPSPGSGITPRKQAGVSKRSPVLTDRATHAVRSSAP